MMFAPSRALLAATFAHSIGLGPQATAAAIANDEPFSQASRKQGTSKYTPHIGAKQLAKAAKRSKGE